jgi:hypothetical protein
MVTLSDIILWLSAISSIAVIAGAGFVVAQLRQNARLLEATLRQQRSDVSITLVERITDPTFPQRRFHMHEAIKRFQATNWKDAFESPDDFEVRNFAYIYELIGVMAKHRLVDIELLVDTFQYLIVRDWQIFEPHARYIQGRYNIRFNAYANFEWLATETRQRLDARGGESLPPPPRN